MRRITPNLSAITLLAALLAGSVRADRITLKNGRILDCTVQEETPKKIIVSLGAGSMEIDRNQIAKIAYSKPGSAQPQPKGNILHPDNVPPAYTELAADFRQLIAARNAALDAQYMTRKLDAEIRGLEQLDSELQNSINTLTEKLVEKQKEVASVEVPSMEYQNETAIRAYNSAIRKKQVLNDEAKLIAAEITSINSRRITEAKKAPEIRRQRKAQMQPVAFYEKALQLFLPRYAEQKKTIPQKPDAATQELFEKIDRYLARFQNEVSTFEVKCRAENNSIFVPVLINETLIGEFVLDTGASSMTLTESFARKLGINPETLPVVTIITADGRKSLAKETTLMSVAVGDAKETNVRVLITPEGDQPREDGLLGMTFLKHFSVSLNGATGEIELTRFNPQ